jgi:hypothetical protein
MRKKLPVLLIALIILLQAFTPAVFAASKNEVQSQTAYLCPLDPTSEGAGKTGTDLARQLGKEGEDAAKIVNAKQRIPSLSGTAKYRIPDELLQDQKILREIKNVSSQSYTNQLKDFNAWTKQNGYQFILEVRPGAKLSGPLQQAINNGEIILKNIGQ